MLVHVAFVSLLAAFLAAAAGYGRTIIRVLDGGREMGLGYAAMVGVVVMSILGGMANDVGLAYRGMLDGILGLGVVLALFEMKRGFWSEQGRLATRAALSRQWADPTFWLASALLVFSSLFLVPTTVLNPHDDLTQYLLRPMLMMQTGTVGSNWFDNTGLDGLGAQSWLQAFFLAHLPLTYADAFDDIICPVLCCLLLNDLGRSVGARRLNRFVAALALICINPVQVNISAKYSIVLMLLGSMTASLVFARRHEETQARPASSWFPLFVAAASGSTAVALKSSAASAVAFEMGFLAIASVALVRGARGRLLAPVVLTATVTAAAVIFCLPFFPQYRAMTFAPRLGEGLSLDLARYTVEKIGGLLTWSGGQFGQRPINTTLGFGAILVLAGVAVGTLARSRREDAFHPQAFVTAVFGLAAVLSFLATIVTTPWSVARYATPVLAATLPATILIGWPYARSAIQPLRAGGRSRSAVAFAICSTVILLNLSSIKERLGLALDRHTASILTPSAALADYLTRAISEERRRAVAAVQAKIPAGGRMLASILDPTDLDFVRNPGYDLYVSGMANPWIGDLGGQSGHDLSRWLETLGIHYVLWQSSGDYLVSRPQLVAAGATPVSFNAKSVRDFLALYDAAAAGTLGPILYAKGNYILFVLDPDFSPTPGPSVYPIGETVSFTSQDANPYLVSGWSSPEPPGTWTDGGEALLDMRPTPAPHENLVVRATYTPLVAAGQAQPVVTVVVGNTDVARWTAAAPATRCATIPAFLVQDGTLRLTLRIEGALSPADLHISSDTRHLGILMQSLSVETASKAGQGCNG